MKSSPDWWPAPKKEEPPKKATALIKPFLDSTATEWGHSRWETLERCPREYSLRYLWGIREQNIPIAPQIGTVVHRGIAASLWAENLAKGEKKKPPKNFWRDVVYASPEPIEARLEALRLVEAHEKFWAERDPGYDKVIAVEQHIKGSINGVPYTTRFDVVAQKKRLPMLIDHKTSSRLAGNPATEFQMSGQFLGALAVWEAAGNKKVPFIRINLIVKTREPQFVRFGLTFSEQQVTRFRKDLTNLKNDLDRYLQTRYFPRHYSACVGKYSPCRYYDLCHKGSAARGDYTMPAPTALKLDEALK